MERIPSEPGQCRMWVKDRRRRRIAEEKKHNAKVKTYEIDEITDNIDKAWGARAHHNFNPIFAGFGEGGGAVGTYVLRNGKLVPK